MPSIKGAYCLTIGAGITASPGVRSAGSVSLFPRPPTVTTPPLAILVGAATKPGFIMPGLRVAKRAPAAAAWL